MNSTHHPPSCTPLPRWSRPRSVRPSPWRTRSSSHISSQTAVSWGRSSCWSPPVRGARSCPYHTPPPSRHCRSGKCRTGRPPPVIQQNIKSLKSQKSNYMNMLFFSVVWLKKFYYRWGSKTK